MVIPDLKAVTANQVELLDALADMTGESFREEMWHVTFIDALDALGASEKRKLEITQKEIRANYSVTAPYGFVYTLEDYAGAVNIYRRSLAQGLTWEDFESRSLALLENEFSAEEKAVLLNRAEEMAVFTADWVFDYLEEGEDFLYIASISIDPKKRGTGAFARLFTPLVAYAQQQNVPLFLDCFTDRLEGLYQHFGFDVLKRVSSPDFEIVERCMVLKS